MFELFNDTFKYGFNVKVKVKFKVKSKKSEKNGQFHYYLLLLYQSVHKREEVLPNKVN